MAIYVAVVYTPGGSRKSDGSLQCFAGEDRDEVVERALAAKREWDSPHRSYQYMVLVGELTHEAVVPVQFRLRTLLGVDSAEAEVANAYAPRPKD